MPLFPGEERIAVFSPADHSIHPAELASRLLVARL